MKTKAIGLLSGGLDSLLAVRLVQRMDVEILGLFFVMGFESEHLRTWMSNPNQVPEIPESLRNIGVQVEIVDIRREFISVLSCPTYGFGSNSNPCIDCKILMFIHARKYMETNNAAFVFTGEVVGQRPMSQHKNAMKKIERASGLTDRVVRPLCGKILPCTYPEQKGLFARSHLLDIHGRSRRKQMRLAANLGIKDFPTPGGGCLLTDPKFSSRINDMLARRNKRLLHIDDPALALVGRHIVLPEGSLGVIGRNEKENTIIERFAHLGWLMCAEQIPGPTTLVEGNPCFSDIEAAARLTARYGKGKNLSQVSIHSIHANGHVKQIKITPAEVCGCHML